MASRASGKEEIDGRHKHYVIAFCHDFPHFDRLNASAISLNPKFFALFCECLMGRNGQKQVKKLYCYGLRKVNPNNNGSRKDHIEMSNDVSLWLNFILDCDCVALYCWFIKISLKLLNKKLLKICVSLRKFSFASLKDQLLLLAPKNQNKHLS